MEEKKKDAEVFYVPNYDSAGGSTCPKCSAKLEPAEYYIGNISDYRSDTYCNGPRKVTETLIRYDGMDKRVGGICPACYEKDQRGNIITFLVVAVITGVIGGLIASGLIRGSMLPDGRSTMTGFGHFILIVLAALLPLICLLCAVSCFNGIRRIRRSNPDMKQREWLSDVLVSHLKDTKQNPAGNRQHMLSLGKVREMRENNSGNAAGR